VTLRTGGTFVVEEMESPLLVVQDFDFVSARLPHSTGVARFRRDVGEDVAGYLIAALFEDGLAEVAD
jgi:hypothetical protein